MSDKVQMAFLKQSINCIGILFSNNSIMHQIHDTDDSGSWGYQVMWYDLQYNINALSA